MGNFAFSRNNRFATKHGAQNMRRHVWICNACFRWHHEQKPRTCSCQCEGFWYFPSTKEAQRAAHLLMQQKYGLIDQLEFHTPFIFAVNGVKIFTYRADATYRRLPGGEKVVEDTKASANPSSWDPVFALKKKLIEAQYCIHINIATGG